jgi:tRNA-guanine transglycosylase
VIATSLQKTHKSSIIRTSPIIVAIVIVIVHIEAASFLVIIMSETKNGDGPRPFKKVKSEENPSLYQPEPIKPEWLELPPELRKDYENSNDSSSSAAWNKCFPYTTSLHLPIVPLHQPPTFTPESPALCFQVHGICGRARAGTLHFPNGGPPVPIPRFMPVGTKGTLKGVLPSEIADMECPIILANTYHLAIQPGTDLIDEVFGGLPKFMGSTIPFSNEDTETKTTKRMFNLLTDSGGFQMVSLAALSQVTEKGVLFESPYTGKPMLLQPEDSIRCQNQIGADIIMQLDDVISSVATDDDRFRIATFRTLRWYDRCVQAHKFPAKQNLYPIMQGALDVSKGGLRELCLAGFRYRDTQQNRIPGFAIGGLAGGESKGEFWKVVDHACRHLPDDRPRYLMGVGYPLDLVVCTALGVDQYDW